MIDTHDINLKNCDRRIICSTDPYLPKNIAVIDDYNIENVFIKMVELAKCDPVNAVIWNGSIDYLENNCSTIFEKIYENLEDIRENNISYDRLRLAKTMPNRLKTFHKKLNRFNFSDTKIEKEACHLVDFYKNLFDKTIINHPNSNLDLAPIQRSYEANAHKPCFHIDSWGYVVDRNEYKNTNFTPIRFLITHVGQGSYFLDNKDVIFENINSSDFKLKKENPIIWQAKQNAVCLITKRHWMHPAVVHSAPAEEKLNTYKMRLTSMFEYTQRN